MGLLDDAIREHLDLKRRRGADPSEVERAEREALGPVRRNPTPSELADAEAEAAPDGAPAYDQADEDGWAHDSLQEAPADAPVYQEPATDAPVYDEPVPPSDFPGADGAPAPEHEAPRRARPFDDSPFEDEPFEEEPFDEEPAGEPVAAQPDAEAPPAASGPGPETAEFNVEDALAAEEHAHAGDDEDVLEETPEFLQDTPDHDRLWFEQRPPKDFDFDE
jgi:hypothetical protein